MKCVCPMGGDRACPDDCPLAVWASLSPSDRKAQRKPIAEKLYKQNFTMEQIATQLGVSHPTIVRDLKEFVHREQTQPRTSARGRKGEGRPKGSGGGRKNTRGQTTLRRPPKKNTPKINGTGFSLRAANRLRGKARDAYMSKWATNNWNKKLEEHSDLKWEHEVQDELQRIVNLEKRWTEQYGDWRQFSMTPCTYKLLSQAAEVLNGLLSKLKFNKTNSNGESKHHVPH